jgi:hypothetical protein
MTSDVNGKMLEKSLAEIHKSNSRNIKAYRKHGFSIYYLPM